VKFAPDAEDFESLGSVSFDQEVVDHGSQLSLSASCLVGW
jgi:hypothetical protein